MKPQSCKGKGRRFQKLVARQVLDAFAHLAEDDVVSTSMGAPGEDVRLSAAARTALPLSLECKCVERLNVWDALQQAERNCPTGADPCLVFTRNRAPAYAVVRWETLLALYRERHLGGGGGGLPPRLVELLREAATYLPATTPA